MKTAFLFPGQGSQSTTMLSDLIDSYDELCHTFEEASDTLGYDVLKVMRDDNKVHQTTFTQPILLTASVALYRLWLEEGGLLPDIMAGHSLGEYSALCCGGWLSFSDALKLVQVRGEYMQSAVAEGVGAMAAIIGPSDEEVDVLCRRVGSEGVMISPANYNAKGQVVVAGHIQAIRLVYELGQREKFKVIPLPVSVPSHCVLMTPASKQLQQILKTVEPKAGSVPVLHNVDAEQHTDPDDIKNVLISQLIEPVQWTKTMDNLYAMGIQNYVECGSDSVLTGLGKRQAQPVNIHAIGKSVERFQKALSELS